MRSCLMVYNLIKLIEHAQSAASWSGGPGVRLLRQRRNLAERLLGGDEEPRAGFGAADAAAQDLSDLRSRRFTSLQPTLHCIATRFVWLYRLISHVE